jgi:hypothetical protein
MISTVQKETDSAAKQEDTLLSLPPYRFVRCNPRFDQHETIVELTVCLPRHNTILEV